MKSFPPHLGHLSIGFFGLRAWRTDVSLRAGLRGDIGGLECGDFGLDGGMDEVSAVGDEARVAVGVGVGVAFGVGIDKSVLGWVEVGWGSWFWFSFSFSLCDGERIVFGELVGSILCLSVSSFVLEDWMGARWCG